VDRLKIVYIASLIVVGVLALSIIYQTTTQTLFPTVELTSNQEFVAVGDEIAANFKIYNPARDPRQFTYAVYLNDEKRYENMVTINPKRNFVFGGQYRAFEPGNVKVTAVVYEGDKEMLIENITYFVTVKAE
jgi:hypothetical protein